MAETWALLSDVHGNLPALERALTHAHEQGADRVAFLGDALGGREDEACCRMLMEEAEVAVFGNRDARVRLPFAPDVVAWLRALPATHLLGEVFLCHSSPASPFPPDLTAAEVGAFRQATEHNHFQLFPYVSGASSALAAGRALAPFGLHTAVHGHTHRQTAWRVWDDRAERSPERKLGLGEDVAIIGVGSVGEGERGRVEYALYAPAERWLRLVSLEPEDA